MPKDRKNLQGFEARHGSAHNNNNGLFISSAAGAAAGGGIIATIVAILLRQNNHHHGTLEEKLKDVMNAWKNANTNEQEEAATSMDALSALLANRNTTLSDLIENFNNEKIQMGRNLKNEREILLHKIRTLQHQYFEAQAVSEWAKANYNDEWINYKKSYEFTKDCGRIREKADAEDRRRRNAEDDIQPADDA